MDSTTLMLQITPLDQLPLLNKEDDLATLIVARAKELGVGIRNRDVLVVGQKAVSKTEGRIVDIDNIRPSARAARIAKKTGKRPEFVEIVLRESSKVLRADGEAFVDAPVEAGRPSPGCHDKGFSVRAQYLGGFSETDLDELRPLPGLLRDSSGPR